MGRREGLDKRGMGVQRKQFVCARGEGVCRQQNKNAAGAYDNAASPKQLAAQPQLSIHYQQAPSSPTPSLKLQAKLKLEGCAAPTSVPTLEPASLKLGVAG